MSQTPILNSSSQNHRDLISATGLSKTYTSGGLSFKRTPQSLKALRQVSLSIHRGEVMGLVGESGSGKSTFGKTLLRLIPADSGRIFVDGKEITHFSPRKMRSIRRRFQVIFQDPFASLSPRMSIRDIIAEPLEIHGIGTFEDRTERAAELLDTVGLGTSHLFRYPHEFSGGQRQRIGIARALALNPDFLLADEAVSALDVSLQAQIVNLLADMKRRFSLTMLFITHDLTLMRYLCDRIAVMYLGTIVETGTAEEVCNNPLHPYTQILLSAVPASNPRQKKERIYMKGERENPFEISSVGCIFNKRCPRARAECADVTPELKLFSAPNTPSEHQAACWLAG